MTKKKAVAASNGNNTMSNGILGGLFWVIFIFFLVNGVKLQWSTTLMTWQAILSYAIAIVSIWLAHKFGGAKCGVCSH